MAILSAVIALISHAFALESRIIPGNSHAPPAAVFLQQSGNDQRKADRVGNKGDQCENRHIGIDSCLNKKEKQYNVT